LHDLGELLLVTTYQPGALYAADLLRLRDGGELQQDDLVRAEALATYLAQIHSQRHEGSPDLRGMLWRRRLRDLLGHGEGIMGLADSYPMPLPYVERQQLQELETLANDWRWRLKPLDRLLCQVHGDFHPFNIVFDPEGAFHVLDRSRGAWGAAADDVSCLSINYLFFSLQRSGQFAGPFVALYRRFWQTYLAQRHGQMLLTTIQPWYAWRALVLASPIWYPDIDERIRRRMLTFARQVMLAERFAWDEVAQYLEGAR
jgi:Ser/Thr protein kinase RdoA (MazF antagonist)